MSAMGRYSVAGNLTISFSSVCLPDTLYALYFKQAIISKGFSRG